MGAVLGLTNLNVELYPQTISEEEYDKIQCSLCHPNIQYMYISNADYGINQRFTTYRRLSQYEFDNIISQNNKRRNIRSIF